MSSELSILAAQAPSKPLSPTTAISGRNVTISWLAPDNGGSAILGYIIKIRLHDGVNFMEDNVNCNGSLSSIVAAQTCTVPISTLRSVPYSIAWGSSIFAKVSAINIYGTSAESDQGNGAILLRIPDPPVSFTNNVTITSATQIGVTWA
jgi:hypothetical protein